MATTKYIETAPGQRVNYDAAQPYLKAQADSGQLKIVSEADAAPTQPAPAPTTPERSPGLLQQAEDAALITADSQKKITDDANLYAANMRQARIDAINTTFQPRLDREAKAGEDRLARVNAMNFNKGIVGSGIDTTKTDDQKQLNDSALRSIENEKATLINEAFNWADKLATDKAAELTKNSKDLADSNVTREKAKYDTASKALESFGTAGVTLDDIKSADPKTYETLRDVGGLSDFQMVTLLNKANPKMNAKLEFKDGVVYQYYVDPKTQKVVITTEKAEGVPANYKAQFAPDGTLVFMPDNFDPNKPYKDQVIVGGKYAKPTSNSDNFINLSSSQKLKLSDFGLDPKSITGLETFLQTNSIDDAINLMQKDNKPLSATEKAQIKAALTGDGSGA